MNPSSRIAITGLGAVCGAGLTADSVWEAVVSGRSSIAPVASWDTNGWAACKAAEMTGVDNRSLVEDRKLHKLLSRTDLYGIHAAEDALRQSGLLEYRKGLDEPRATQFNDRSGIFVGSGATTYQTTYELFPALTATGGELHAFGREFSTYVNPMLLLRHLPNNVLCHVGIRNGLKGTNACITNHAVSGALAVAEAAAAIRADEADRAVVVGHDQPLEPEMMFYYQRLGLLAEDTVRSFDENRTGTILGEGAAALVLEKFEDAERRGAKILGEFLGSGCATEATGVTDVRPDGDGLSRAICLALNDAGVSPDDIGMIVAHGNGTPMSDASEAGAIRKVFGEKIPPITGFKWAFGHLIAASGSLDFVLALRALRDRVVPGIPTLRELDPGLAPLPVSSSPQEPRGKITLVHCRGFGGMDVALLARGV